MEAAAIAKALAEVRLFAALPQPDRDELAGRMRLRRFARDEVVFHRDDPATHLYLILSGTTKVTFPDEGGREAIARFLRAGDIFGELALFDDAPRSATVTAVAELATLTLSRDDFLHILERSPRATRETLGLLARTIRGLSGRLEDLIFLDVPGRVAKCLIDLAETMGTPAHEITLTQDDLAAFVGATRVSVNRVLADLESRGMIKVSRRRIAVLDPIRLQKEIRH